MSSTVPKLLDVAKHWVTRDPTLFSPRRILAGDASFFSESLSLSVKKSKSRFFMYEEHIGMKLKDENEKTQILQLSPSELAEIMHGQPEHDASKTSYHYWTSPINDVAPTLLQQFKGYKKLHDDSRLLDPRGPSLWIGSSGSSTQAHYDVADNVICQLFGTKRIRCYSPKTALNLHVFPDAHPRARKSQVNFDNPDHDLFLHFSSLPPPEIDVELQPGSSLFIPAFWFHHVENGTREDTSTSVRQEKPGPSVSLNFFALSNAMMVAQNIFQEGSLNFKAILNSDLEHDFNVTVLVLRELSSRIIEGLHMESPPSEFIKKHILDARYTPLRKNIPQNTQLNPREQSQTRRPLTSEEERIVSCCLARVIPHFESLRKDDSDDGILTLILCHLFELWAVGFVGASSVADVWEAVLLMDN